MVTQNGNSDSSDKTQLRQSVSPWSLKHQDEESGEQLTPLSEQQSVGREGCDITLASPHTSRRHATITIKDGALHIEDLQSANGTLVNGVKITTVELKNGDVVCFDTQEFTVVGPEPESAPEAEDSGKTMLRPAVESDKTMLRPAVEAEKETSAQPVEEGPDEKSETGGGDSESKGGAWYERDAPQGTRQVSASDLEGLTAEGTAQGGTQVVRNVQNIEMPSLIGSTGDLAGKVFKLESDAMTIGRGLKDTHIVIDEPSVSSKHAQIVKQGDNWKIVDLMSTSGTFVNGKKTQASFLSPGDAVRLGRVELRFVIDSTDVPSKASAEEYITGTGGKSADSKGSIWLYVAIGFAAVLAVGAYVLFSA